MSQYFFSDSIRDEQILDEKPSKAVIDKKKSRQIHRQERERERETRSSSPINTVATLSPGTDRYHSPEMRVTGYYLTRRAESVLAKVKERERQRRPRRLEGDS